MFSFAGSSVFAGDVTTAYLELQSNTVTAIMGGTLRARITLLDAAGNTADTINGSPISEAVVEIESVNLPTVVGFEQANISDTVTPPLSTGKFTPSLTNASAQFAINYPGADLEEGSDTIKVTVKKGTTIVATKEKPVNIVLPTANTYAVVTGGLTALPDVLAQIPVSQNDKGAVRPAGDKVKIDVFSAYYDGSKYYFTSKLPAPGAENVIISETGRLFSSSATLVDGHVALEATITNLNIPNKLSGSANTQAATLADFIENGVELTFSAYSSVTREIGATIPADIFQTGDPILRINYTDQNYGKATTGQTDTAKFVPAAFNKLSIVGLPINAITQTEGIYNYVGDNNPQSVSPLDAYNFVAKPTQTKPNQNKFFAPGDSTGYVVGAILGWDSYDNPAPFNKTGATAPFKLMCTVSPINEGVWYTSAADGDTTVITAAANNPFIPFQILDSTGGTKVYFDPTYAGTPTAIKNAVTNIDTNPEGVLFDVKNNKELGYTTPPSVVSSPVSPEGFQVANDTVNIQANGFGGDELNIRYVTNSGAKVKINQEDETEVADFVTIPADSKDVNKAEADVWFFTKVASGSIRAIIETGTQLATFVALAPQPLTIGLTPADPGDFPPSSVRSNVATASVILDSEGDHDTVGFESGNISISDNFGNSYSTNATLEDADPVVEVFKEDGITAFPGSGTDVSDNIISFSINPANIAPDAQKAIVKITAGAASASVTVNLRALQQTKLASVFVPLSNTKIETPVKLNFGDQNGILIKPVSGATTPGTFGVDLEATDGLVNNLEDLTQNLTTIAPSAILNAKAKSGKTSMTIEADGGDADASNTTLTLDFLPVDTTSPTIGAVTAGSCSISVAFADDKGLNLADSTIVVKNESGADITSQLSAPAIDGEGTTAGSISFTGAPIGLYTLDITVKDTSGNITTGQKPANVTICTEGTCVSVDPTYAIIGTDLKKDVTITGANTNFGAASTVAFSCAGITVDSITATSLTTIVASISIAADAEKCVSDVTVTTGLEVVTCAQAFELTDSIIPPTCVTVSPNTFNAGDTDTDVTITLKDIDLTKFAEGFSASNVSFGCTGVTVNSATVNSATEIAATITVAATAQDCTGGDVTITGASDVGIVCKGAITVIGKKECTITIDPPTVKTGFLFPRTHTITVTASEGCVFDATTTVEVSGQKVEIVGTPVISGNTVTVQIRTRPVILGGKGETTLTVKTGEQTATATLTVTGLFF